MATATKTNYRQQAPVLLVKPSGVTRPFGFGAANAAAVGTAMLAAQTAAVSGDLIQVYADATISNPIGKAGVDWWFAPVTITASGTSTAISDGGSAVSYRITGSANFVTTNAKVVDITGNGSSVFLVGNKFRAVGGTEGGVKAGVGALIRIFATESIESADTDAIYANSGTIYFNAPLVDGGEDGVEGTDNLSNGPAYIEGSAQTIRGRGTAVNGVGIHLNLAATCRIKCQTILGEGTAKQSIRLADVGLTGESLIEATDVTGHILIETGYMRLVGATVTATATNQAAVQFSPDGEVAITFEDCRFYSSGTATYAFDSGDLVDGDVTLVGTSILSPDAVNSNVSVVRSGKAADTVKVAGVTPGTTGLALLDDATASAARDTLGASSGVFPVSVGGTGAGTLTGIVKGNGTSAMTAVTAPSGTIVGDTDTQTLTNKTLTSPTINGGTFTGGTDIAVADGGTGASTAAAARTNLGTNFYTSRIVHSGFTTFAASGTFYFSNSNNASTFSSLNGREYPARAGSLVRLRAVTIGGGAMATAGSETTLQVSKNGGSWTSVTTTAPLFTSASTTVDVDLTSFSFTHSVGDYYQIRMQTPAWATAPTGANIDFTLEFTY